MLMITMESTMQLLFLGVLLKAISGQDEDEAALRGFLGKILSPECNETAPATEDPSRCCIVPELFDNETNVGCRGVNDEPLQGPVIRGSPECAERTCILRNNDLLFDNDVIDKDSLKQYMNEWVAKRKEFIPAVNAIKDICLGKKPMFGFPMMCDADKLLMCIKSNFFNKCPNWLDTEACTSTRTFMERCLPYFD